MGEPVEKVATEPIGGPQSSSKCPETGLSVPKWGSEKGTTEFFNRLKGLLGNCQE
jgi:hypothetical protein